jgi:hypothetical protein
MTDKEKLDIISRAFEDTIWMAIRYANGRRSYSPGMVRDAVKMYQSVYPDWKPKYDSTITDDFAKGYSGSPDGDCLADILNQENK